MKGIRRGDLRRPESEGTKCVSSRILFAFANNAGENPRYPSTSLWPAPSRRGVRLSSSDGVRMKTRVVTAVLLVAAIVILCVAPLAIMPDTSPAAVSKLTNRGVTIFNADGTRWFQWNYNDAVKFSLDQVVTTIRYLFAAAAAGMAFIGKILIEPRVGAAQAHGLPRRVQDVLIATVVLWISSLFCGMVAHLYIAEIGTAESFSIYGRVGVYVLFQLIEFGVGLLLFLVALVLSL